MLDRYAILETPPTVEPIAVGEARQHVALDHDCDDALLSRLIAAARAVVEKETRSRLVTRNVELRLPGAALFAGLRCGFDLPLGPATAVVSSIGLVNGAPVNLATPLLEAPGQLAGRVYWPANSDSPPSLDDVPGAWRLTVSVGYGASGEQVPAPLKHALLLLVGHWYEQREAVVVGTIASELPRGVDALLALYTVP